MNVYPWHTNKLGYFRNLISHNRLHHAILLQSQAGSGIDTFSLALSKALLCKNTEQSPCDECKSCSLFEAESHPDFHQLLSEKTQIGVDLVRIMIEKVAKTAQLSGNKVILINDIDTMTEAAANAFLKTLEEPTENTFMIMTTSSPHLLMATIKSRCEKHVMNLPTYSESLSFFNEKDIEPISEESLQAYGNSPLIYLEQVKENKLGFDSFSKDFGLLISGDIDVSTFVDRNGESPINAIDWIYNKILNLLHATDLDTSARIDGLHWLENELIVAKKRVRQTGTNKSLLLSSMLYSLKSSDFVKQLKRGIGLFVDSHCHLDRISDDPNATEQYVRNAQEANVEHMLCVAVSVKEFSAMKSAVNKFPNVSMSCGVHPLHQEDACDYDTLLKHAKSDDVVAVGETGLDYHYSEETKEVQIKSFIDHVKVANVVKKPLIIHTRAAQEDTLNILNEYYDRETGAVLHCFTESLEMAKAAMEMGIYISISGIITFNSAKELRETVKQIPLEKLLIETDSPWLTPAPHRGKQNEPKYVKRVAEYIADLKGLSVQSLAEQTTNNFYQLFSKINRP